MERIHQVFISVNMTAQIDQIFLEIPDNESFIPKDILANHSAVAIWIGGNDTASAQFCPEIQSGAFRSSSNVNEEFYISSLDMRKIDWSFLNGFIKLRILSINYAVNVELSKLPSLPKLTDLGLHFCKGVNDWTHFPNLSNGLKYLAIVYSGLNDNALDRILDWVLRGLSNGTLRNLCLSENALTCIPRQLKYFPCLVRIHLDGQKYPGFGTISDLSLPAPVIYLNLSSSYITTVLAGAFKGNCFSIVNLSFTFKIIFKYL